MTTELRDKDLAILQAIQDGASTTSEVREATTLTTREINYSINEYSLEQLGLIHVHRPEGREWQEYDGHEKNTWKPKQLELTDEGIRYLANHEPGESGYEDLSKQELIHRIEDLEQRMERMEQQFTEFRSRVMDRL